MMEWPQKEPAESGATIVTTQQSNVKHTAEGMANHGRLPLELADGVVPCRKVSRRSRWSTSGGSSNAIFKGAHTNSSDVPVHLAGILYLLLAV
jgi:hypothetical protein